MKRPTSVSDLLSYQRKAIKKPSGTSIEVRACSEDEEVESSADTSENNDDDDGGHATAGRLLLGGLRSGARSLFLLFFLLFFLFFFFLFLLGLADKGEEFGFSLSLGGGSDESESGGNELHCNLIIIPM